MSDPPATIPDPILIRRWTVGSVCAMFPWAVAAVLGTWLLVIVVSVIASRITGPFLPKDQTSGTVIDHCIRVRDGLPLYAAPTLDFVPYLYTPGYYYITAMAMRVFGESVLVARLTSLALVVAAALFMVLTVRSICRSIWPLVLVGPLAGCGYAITEYCYDYPRIDSALTLAICAAVWAVVSFRGWWSGIVVGLMLTAAFWCKQSSAIFGAAFLLGWLVLDWRPTLTAGIVWAGATIATTVWANAATNGWFWTYVVEIPRTHDFNVERMIEFLVKDWFWWTQPDRPGRPGSLLIPLAFALMSAVFLWSGWRKDRVDRSVALLLAAFAAAAAYAVASRTNWGATEKVLMPVCLLASGLLPVVVWREWNAARNPLSQGLFRFISGGLVALLIFSNLFDRTEQLPTDENLSFWQDMNQEIERYAGNGPIWVPWGYVTTRMTGQGMRAGQMALSDYLGGQFGDESARELPESIRQAIETRYFEAVFYYGSRQHGAKGREGPERIRRNSFADKLGLMGGAYESDPRNFIELERQWNRAFGVWLALPSGSAGRSVPITKSESP